ncbi:MULTISPECIES: hypothetical protein [unclassified Mesorhizobium]|uniref:hypothetical protein n=1 Tax=unclassified Mesorhizobium TaxID=325217 RepID=UPI000FD2EDBC|nr:MULTISPECIES: hypothetical protein [unclassified Mesorhizobium]RUV10282.1 hypothetical protein EOA86_35905 [Mesorhizobium sp. M5C.F.Ca.IN.020.32.2.1]RUV65431.1 hypothetical protein EOA88_31900 [Mesorhizobium sp. M5C.F.Ca.IN.020.14.1.1]RWL05503.1 MAG: hypothetical protein EOR56_29725 [Mesorhizobium sp.]
MSETAEFSRDDNLIDIVEKLRAEQFPDVDRALVLEILHLHGGAERPENLTRKVDEALVAAATEQG